MRMIAAVDENWGLGKNGDLLTSIPEDMRFFRQTTQGKVLVMGSKTLRSFPNAKPLPGRLNVVMTRQKDARFPGCVVCDGMDSLLALLAGFAPDDVMVIGGGGVYTQLLPYCTEALITKMQFNGEADTFLPNLDSLPEWSVAKESEQKEHEGILFSFVTYANSAVKPIGDSAAPLSSDM
ncbi:MAG: dihydrofolate reductase, partial [Ruminococcus sp.]|nr:dihydrofolate reductase [Ruminococcus sp.]